jgi:hypothetical protein
MASLSAQLEPQRTPLASHVYGAQVTESGATHTPVPLQVEGGTSVIP